MRIHPVDSLAPILFFFFLPYFQTRMPTCPNVNSIPQATLPSPNRLWQSWVRDAGRCSGYEKYCSGG